MAATNAVSREFFSPSTVNLARALLGCVLLHDDIGGMIVETEAYLGIDDLGAEDLAAHSSRGKTGRTAVIFGPPGHAYVYFIYGMHECLNIVAEPEGKAGCVLIRALQPLSGFDIMRQRRHWQGDPHGLTNGPGKLTEALAITRAQYGASLYAGSLALRTWREPPEFTIDITPRIGIRHCADWPLRFIWKGNPCVSRVPASGRANRPKEST